MAWSKLQRFGHISEGRECAQSVDEFDGSSLLSKDKSMLLFE